MTTPRAERATFGSSWRAGERDFLAALYDVLRQYQDGELKGDSTTIGQLDQPLTQVVDMVQVEIRKRVRSWRKESQ